MTGPVDDRAPEAKSEPCTESTCEQCGTAFVPKNRNRLRVRFCRRACSTAWHNAQRLKGAALLKVNGSPRRRGPSKRARAVSQAIFLAMVPVDERAALIAQAASNLGITDEGEILAAYRRAQVPPYEGTV